MPDGSYGGNPCGFVIESSDGNFYYSGDTALTSDMKLVGELTKLSFAVLLLRSRWRLRFFGGAPF